MKFLSKNYTIGTSYGSYTSEINIAISRCLLFTIFLIQFLILKAKKNTIFWEKIHLRSSFP